MEKRFGTIMGCVARAFPLVGLMACASGGPGAPAPERTAILAAFAGSWRIDEPATAQAADISGTRPQDHLNQRGSDLAMEMMREQGAGGDAVSGTPAGLRQTMLMVGITPEGLTLQPDATGFSITFDAEDPIAVPLDGSWAEASTPQGTVEARLRWRGDGFAIERRIPGGGTIRDDCSLVESGHLLVSREIVWRRARQVGLIVYRKQA